MDEFGSRNESRHSWWARRFRQGLYYLFIDRKSWPITFESPTCADDFPSAASPNIYVHLPFCEKLCYYCPYIKFPFDKDQHQQYGKVLLNEIEDFLDHGSIKPLQSIYFGGGSPSLSISLVERVLNRLRPHIQKGAELAIELHPIHCNPSLFRRLKSIGFNKVSIGAESFSAAVLESLCRPYTPQQARLAVKTAKQEGFECVDVNLMYAIPGQTMDQVISDVNMALSLDADHISAYPLFSFHHTGEKNSSGSVGWAEFRKRIAIQKKVADLCLKQGYERTSVWSFTRPGTSPYTTVTRDSYRGFGVGAGSKIDDIFWFNSFSLDYYLQTKQVRPVLIMRAGNRFRRFHWLYWQIYCTVINPDEYRLVYGRNLEHDFRWIILLMRILGWITPTGNKWKLTENGAIFAHIFQSLFSLSYIDILWTQSQRESRPQRVVLE